MLTRSRQFRMLVAAAGGFILLHWLCILLFPAHAALVSYPFVVGAPLLAFVGCSRHFRSGASSARIAWSLTGLSLLLWASGIIILSFEELSLHVSPEIASFADFDIAIFGVPILLAISTPSRRDGGRLFVWLDGIQACMTAYLIYVAFFSVSPFTHKQVQPISARRLVLIYTLESLLLAGGATLRFIAHRKDGAMAYFYKVLSTYLWLYVVAVSLLNYAYITRNGLTGFFDLWTDLAFFYLGIAAFTKSPESSEDEVSFDRRPLVMFVDNVSPTIFTAALFSLCFAVVRTHQHIGIGSLILGFAIYCIRATSLQSRFIRTQQELLQTQQHLEEISLTDSLTGLSNRRCFDRTFEDEWDRAVRTRQPLALLMIDVDHFKRLNDRHGHLYGDGCLRKIAQAMRDELPRSGDMLARYGGEEFVILLPTTGIQGAAAVSRKMQAAVDALKIENESAVGPFATISIGVAVMEFPTSGTLLDLIGGADSALYRAKENGRNRVEYDSLEGCHGAIKVQEQQFLS
ncbi:GGDEF domain-containing protein [Granulicella arctica]|uniref:GGDEF domain-containing protein n=1 Tax=Granulicella arctica TaxID=940613 RepID=UPI0021DFEC63|nr:diguanylate cyclase [Granulicella arctica]